MSLTIFLNPQTRSVKILQWFLDSSGAIECARGPLMHFDETSFRKQALRIIRDHFREYKRIRFLHGSAVEPAFDSRKEGRLLSAGLAIRIAENPPDVLRLIPYEFRNFSAKGMVPLPQSYERSVPIKARSAVFWKAFDEVSMANLSI